MKEVWKDIMETQKDTKGMMDLGSVDKNALSKYLKDITNKVPIKKGCRNKVCYCTGDCNEVVGYRDKGIDELI